MDIERLEKRGIRVQDLQIEPVESPKISQAQHIYEDIKMTGLYDPLSKRWNKFMNYYEGNKENIFAAKPTANQLLSIYVEGLFDKEDGQRQLEALKETAFYDKDAALWRHGKSEEGRIYKFFKLKDQFVGIWTQSIVDPTEAQKQYGRLQKSGFYNKYDGNWTTNNSKIESSDQLLRILVERSLGLSQKETVKKRFQELKKTQLFDEETQQWNSSIDKYEDKVSTILNSDTQLLGILVESVFDKGKAQKQYDILKTTELYDADRRQWKEGMVKNTDAIRNVRATASQLLGVIVEHTLGMEEPNYAETYKQLPEVRRF